jgi:hypothetical protein
VIVRYSPERVVTMTHWRRGMHGGVDVSGVKEGREVQ